MGVDEVEAGLFLNNRYSIITAFEDFTLFKGIMTVQMFSLCANLSGGDQSNRRGKKRMTFHWECVFLY